MNKKKLLLTLLITCSTIFTGCTNEEVEDTKTFIKSVIKISNNLADNLFQITDEVQADEEFQQITDEMVEKINNRFNEKYKFFSEDKCTSDDENDKKYFDITKSLKDNLNGSGILKSEDSNVNQKNEQDDNFRDLDANIEERFKGLGLSEQEIEKIKEEIIKEVKEEIKEEILKELKKAP